MSAVAASAVQILVRGLLLWLAPAAALSAQTDPPPPALAEQKAPSATARQRQQFVAELNAKSVEAPVPGGRVVRVVDGRSGEPVAGASILLVPQSQLEPEVMDLWQRLGMQHTEAGFAGRFAPLLRLGRRWVTDVKGTASVVPDFMSWCVVAGDAIAEGSAPHLPVTIEVYPCVSVDVRAVSADGTPAARVPVRLITAQGHSFHEPTCFTDDDGRARLDIPYAAIAQRLAMALSPDFPCPTSHRVAFMARERALDGGPPLELRLPPLAWLHVTARSADGKPRAIEWLDVSESSDVSEPSAAATRFEYRPPKAAPFAVPFAVPTVLGGELHAMASFADQIGFQQVKVTTEQEDGPVTSITFDACALPMLQLRVLGRDGLPFARRRVVLQHSFGGATTDRDGRVYIAVPPLGLAPNAERVTLVGLDRLWRPVGAVNIALPKELPLGVADVGDHRLVEEPVVVAGCVVDENGKPIEGATVMRVGLPLGEVGMPLYMFPPAATTDSEGRFTMRMANFDGTEIGLSVAVRNRVERTTSVEKIRTTNVRIVVR